MRPSCAVGPRPGPDLRVLLLHVEETRVVRRLRTVADAVADHDGLEAEAHGVDDAGARNRWSLPATSRVRTPLRASHGPRPVPKNADGTVLRTTSSRPPARARARWHSPARIPVSDSIPGILAEEHIVAAIVREDDAAVEATGHCRLRASARKQFRDLAIAAEMLPPPNTAGSAKPFTKSTMSSAWGGYAVAATPNPGGNRQPSRPAMCSRTSSALHLDLLDHDVAIDDHGLPVQNREQSRASGMSTWRQCRSCRRVRCLARRPQHVAVEARGSCPCRRESRRAPCGAATYLGVHAPANVAHAPAARIAKLSMWDLRMPAATPPRMSVIQPFSIV